MSTKKWAVVKVAGKAYKPASSPNTVGPAPQTHVMTGAETKIKSHDGNPVKGASTDIVKEVSFTTKSGKVVNFSSKGRKKKT